MLLLQLSFSINISLIFSILSILYKTAHLHTVSKYFGIVSYKYFAVADATSEGFKITQFPAAIAPIIGRRLN